MCESTFKKELETSGKVRRQARAQDGEKDEASPANEVATDEA